MSSLSALLKMAIFPKCFYIWIWIYKKSNYSSAACFTSGGESTLPLLDFLVSDKWATNWRSLSSFSYPPSLHFPVGFQELVNPPVTPSLGAGWLWFSAHSYVCACLHRVPFFSARLKASAGLCSMLTGPSARYYMTSARLLCWQRALSQRTPWISYFLFYLCVSSLYLSFS